MATPEFTRALAALAEEHDGVVTRRQLLRNKHSEYDIKDAVRRGHLTAALRGVYLIGRSTLSQRALLQVATLHASPAMTIGRSAAEHRGLLTPRTGVVTVGTARTGMNEWTKTLIPMSGQRAPGLIRVRPIVSVDAEIIDGVPSSRIPDLLLDLAAKEKESMLRHVWKQAEYRRLLDLRVLSDTLDHTNRPKARLVRELVERHPGTDDFYRSAAEVDFRQMVADAGLPAPIVNAPLTLDGARFVADFLWVDEGVVAEVDDPSHDRASARSWDKARDAAFAAAGLVVVRFETVRLGREGGRCMDQLGATLRRRRNRPR